ncbi:MAG: phage tail sheath family protein [Gammaproteobacteria bacterium]|nr:phage tail sheath family protein [Gammaproteobacteria bacterium]
MPITTTYPGVYIEEVPSGVRTIVGVATSITAIIGRAVRGPVNKAKTINSYADYERIFGGLALSSAMSFAVRDFYLNGGGQAVIVRLYRVETGEDAKSAKATLSADNVDLEAASAGAWGNKLSVIVSHDDLSTVEVAAEQGLNVSDLFNIKIKDGNTGSEEQYLNISVVDGPRRIDKVLENKSQLVRVEDGFILPATRPGDGTYTVAAVDEASDGDALTSEEYTGVGLEAAKKGLYALEQVDLFNLLCLPPEGENDDYPAGLVAASGTYCEKRRAMFLVDSPSGWDNKANAKTGMQTGVGTKSKNAAIFFPRLKKPNPRRDNQIEEFVPCGAIAGIFTRTDNTRGVWKAPAGIEATLRGVSDLSVNLTNEENGELNPLGLNCLRSFPIIGRVVWGSRTLKGADQLASEWKYIPVRRITLFIEESLYRGTQWVVFEPNDEPLWAQIRLNVGAFMHNLFRKGAFQGTSPRDAYFVKCDKDTTTQNDIDLGIVNIEVGFAPLKPAEFVIIKIQQIAGQIEV